MSGNFYVYAYFRLDGTPCYIGKGTGERWLHRGSYGRNRHFLRICQQAWDIGRKLPCEKLVENLNHEEALELEAFFIAAIGREVDGGPLVNLSVGGDQGPIGFKWTPELNALNPRHRGKKHSPESRARTSAKLKGRAKTPEHIEAAAAALRGKRKKNGWWSTEEGRAKQRANNHGRGNNPHSDETKLKIKQARFQQEALIAVRKSSTWANQNSVRFSIG